jgi:hypothetical protein
VLISKIEVDVAGMLGGADMDGALRSIELRLTNCNRDALSGLSGRSLPPSG